MSDFALVESCMPAMLFIAVESEDVIAFIALVSRDIIDFMPTESRPAIAFIIESCAAADIAVSRMALIGFAGIALESFMVGMVMPGMSLVTGTLRSGTAPPVFAAVFGAAGADLGSVFVGAF